MADYIIQKTDPANGSFTIKPYTTNGPATPVAAVPLDANAVSANTSIVLLGKGMVNYGDIVASDFVHLLENFSNPIAPVYPLQGQLWYKNDISPAYPELRVYDGAWNSIVINGKLNADLNVTTHKIVNLADPVANTDAVNKQWVLANTFTTAGATMDLNANITFNGGEVLGLPAIPTTSGSATSKAYVDTSITNATLAIQSAATADFVNVTGDTMTGGLIMAANQLITLPTPVGGFTNPSDVINKDYVDTATAGITNFVLKTGDIMTGTLNIDGIGMYNGPQQTVISSNAGTSTLTVSGNQTALFLLNKKFHAVLDASRGYQVVDVGGTITGADPTGLTNDATAYTADITIDGVLHSVSISGSTAQDYTSLLFQINAILGAAGTASLVNFDLQITSSTSDVTSTVSIVDTGPNLLFASLTTYASILTAVAGMPGQTELFTISADSTLNLNSDTEIIVIEPVTVTSTLGDSTVGIITPVLGLEIVNNASVKINTGSNIDFGANILHNIQNPVVNDDAANKQYVDAAILAAPVPPGDGYLSSATFIDNTLTLTNTGGIVPTVVIPDIARSVHGHLTTEVLHDVTGGTASDSFFRDTFRPPSPGFPAANYPAVNTADILTAIDSALYTTLSSNDRAVYTVVQETVDNVARAYTPVQHPIVAHTTGAGTSSFTISGGDFTTTFVAASVFVVSEATIPGTTINTMYTVTSSVYNGAGPNTTTINIAENLVTASNDGVIGSTVIDHVSGLGGSYTISGGDFTAAFKPRIKFQVNNSIGVPNATHEVVSSSYFDGHGYQEANVGGTKTGASLTGLANNANNYTADITVDGVVKNIQVTGSLAQTYTLLLNEINTDLAGAAIASLVGGNIRVTSVTYGTTSTVSIVDVVGTPPGSFALFGALTGYVGLSTAVSHDFGPQTTINVVGTVVATTNTGRIGNFYGALEITGNALSKYGSGVKFNLSSNTNAPSNGNYTSLSSSTSNQPLLASYFTWIYMDPSTLLPVATAGDGFIIPYSILLPFQYQVESNRLQVYAQGVKQYNSTRGYSVVSIPVYGNDIVEWKPTPLVPAFSYTFDINVNGGGNTLITISKPAYILDNNEFVVSSATAGSNGSFTIETTLPAQSFPQFSLFEVAGNAYQVVNVGGNKIGTDATNLVPATTYTATVVIDGGAGPLTKNISILGSTAQTFTTLLSELQADLDVGGVVAKASLIGGNIRITSAQGDATSNVVIAAGTLFAAPLNGFVSILGNVSGNAYQDAIFSPTKIGADSTGLANDATVYAASVVINSTPHAVSITGSTAQTFTTLLNEINADLSGFATASLVNGSIRIISATAGAVSTVSITDTNLFSQLNGFSAFAIAVIGTAVLSRYTVKSALSLGGGLTKITVNETVPYSTATGSFRYPYTYTNLVSDIQTQLTAALPTTTPKVKVHHGKLYFWSPTSSTGSSVVVADTITTPLFAALGATLIDNTNIGANYAYIEPGVVFQNSRLVELSALPFAGDVYECITVG